MTRSLLLALPLLAASLAAQQNETLEQRVERIERENREIRAMLAEREAGQDPDAIELPPGFDRVYATDEGVSIAGYGEYLFTQRSGRTDVADALRTVLYVGYRFDEKWLFHSEIELEHGTTSASSGTTSSEGSVSVELGYLEYEACSGFSVRAGMLLVPVGLVNEEHEPTLFLPAQRSQTEMRIIPTTWRELGVEGVAEVGDWSFRGFVGTGLDGEEFGASGLRGGRQKGNRAAADDIATAWRVDYHCCEEATFGGSVFYQRAGQDGLQNGTVAIPELDTVIVEGHVDWRPGPAIVRGLWASAFSDDAAAFAAATGQNLARRSDGYYVELGCDVAPWVMPESDAAIIPFVRHEHIDTQAKMPGGFAADPAQENEILTVGLHVRPTDQIVFKLDFEEWDNSFDRLNIGMGYVF